MHPRIGRKQKRDEQTRDKWTLDAKQYIDVKAFDRQTIHGSIQSSVPIRTHIYVFILSCLSIIIDDVSVNGKTSASHHLNHKLSINTSIFPKTNYNHIANNKLKVQKQNGNGTNEKQKKKAEQTKTKPNERPNQAGLIIALSYCLALTLPHTTSLLLYFYLALCGDVSTIFFSLSQHFISNFVSEFRMLLFTSKIISFTRYSVKKNGRQPLDSIDLSWFSFFILYIFHASIYSHTTNEIV